MKCLKIGGRQNNWFFISILKINFLIIITMPSKSRSEVWFYFIISEGNRWCGDIDYLNTFLFPNNDKGTKFSVLYIYYTLIINSTKIISCKKSYQDRPKYMRHCSSKNVYGPWSKNGKNVISKCQKRYRVQKVWIKIAKHADTDH